MKYDLRLADKIDRIVRHMAEGHKIQKKQREQEFMDYGPKDWRSQELEQQRIGEKSKAKRKAKLKAKAKAKAKTKAKPRKSKLKDKILRRPANKYSSHLSGVSISGAF